VPPGWGTLWIIPNWGYWINQKSGWNKSMEQRNESKRRPNCCSHLNWSSQEFHPQFWICLTEAIFLPYIKVLPELYILRILWTDGCPVSLNAHFFFLTTLKLGMKKGLGDETRAQRQGTIMDNFVMLGPIGQEGVFGIIRFGVRFGWLFLPLAPLLDPFLADHFYHASGMWTAILGYIVEWKSTLLLLVLEANQHADRLICPKTLLYIRMNKIIPKP
jgi:hypothetical protein